MLRIGLCYLETFLDPDKGKPWLKRADEWFQRVAKLDTQLNEFQVPDKSWQVAQPPKTERTKDLWTNTVMSAPKPGDLFNRRECDWYISSLHKQAVTFLGLVAYAKQDYPKAKELWTRLYAIDSQLQTTASSRSMSFADRLIWNVDHNKGALYAEPEQMAAFTNKSARFALLNADMEMELQNYSQAQRKFEQLMNVPAFKSNREQAAYCTFALAITYSMQLNLEKANALFTKFTKNQPYDKTLVAPRALFLCAINNAQNQYRKDEFDFGNKVHEYLFTTYPQSKYADDSFYYWSRNFKPTNEPEKTIQNLQTYLIKYPNGKHRNWAQKHINRLTSNQSKGSTNE